MRGLQRPLLLWLVDRSVMVNEVHEKPEFGGEDAVWVVNFWWLWVTCRRVNFYFSCGWCVRGLHRDIFGLASGFWARAKLTMPDWEDLTTASSWACRGLDSCFNTSYIPRLRLLCPFLFLCFLFFSSCFYKFITCPCTAETRFL